MPELLLIDDDPFALALSQKTARYLLPTSRIRIFPSAKDALEYLSLVNGPCGTPPDRSGLICCDLEMPEMDGFGFLEEFGRLPMGVQEKYKVFILSSCKNREQIARLYEIQCFEGFCPKPLTVEKLNHMLRLVIDR